MRMVSQDVDVEETVNKTNGQDAKLTPGILFSVPSF